LRCFVGYLLVHNDVPVGYGDALLLLEWGEVNFHVFESFRQGESARMYGEVLRVFHAHHGLRFLFLNRYQFGHHNADAIRSGGFWSDDRLGFRPAEPGTRARRAAEAARLAAGRGLRSTPATLRRLAASHMALVLDGDPQELEARYRGFHPLQVGLALTRR